MQRSPGVETMRGRQYRMLGFACAIAVLPVSFPVLACGDKLSALGGGVRLERVISTRHPGAIVIVGPATEPLSATLSSALRRAGHDVRLAATADELGRTLSERAADIVLVESTAAMSTAAVGAGRAYAPTVVPVIYRPTRRQLDDARAGAKCVIPVMGWGTAPAVRAVEDIRSRQASGVAMPCTEAGSERRS